MIDIGKQKPKRQNILKDICEFYGLTHKEMGERMFCSHATMTAKLCQFRTMTINDIIMLVWNFGYPGSFVKYENIYENDHEDIYLHVHIEADDNNTMLRVFDKRYICTPGKELREV